jgi:hypothetical protein
MEPEHYVWAVLEQLTKFPDAQTVNDVAQALNLDAQEIRATMVRLCDHSMVRATLSGFRITHKGWDILEEIIAGMKDAA